MKIFLYCLAVSFDDAAFFVGFLLDIPFCCHLLGMSTCWKGGVVADGFVTDLTHLRRCAILF